MQSRDERSAFASAAGSAEPGLVMARRKAITVEESVQRDLKLLPEALAGSGLAASALALARDLDAEGTSATARAACSRSLVQVQRELRSLAPPAQATDALDELTARRKARG